MILFLARLWFPGMCFAQRVLSSFGWNPVLMQRSQALDLGQTIKCGPLHASDYTPYACHDADDCFSSKWRLGELSTTHHHSWKPQESAWTTESGSFQYKKGGVTLFIQNRQALLLGKNKVLLLDLSRNAPKLLINL